MHCFVVCVLFGEEKIVKKGIRFLFLVSTYGLEEWELDDWKPSIRYYDFFAQSTDQARVKQVFPFVKVSRFFIIGSFSDLSNYCSARC